MLSEALSNEKFRVTTSKAHVKQMLLKRRKEIKLTITGGGK